MLMGDLDRSGGRKEIIAIITQDSHRYLGGQSLALLARSEEEQMQMTRDIARAMKADVVKLSTGDYLILIN